MLRSNVARKVRKSFFVDPVIVKRAKRLLGVATEAEVIRLSVERIVEMEEFWRFMDKSQEILPLYSFEKD